MVVWWLAWDSPAWLWSMGNAYAATQPGDRVSYRDHSGSEGTAGAVFGHESPSPFCENERIFGVASRAGTIANGEKYRVRGVVC